LLRATVAMSAAAARLLSALPGRAGHRLSGAAYSVIFNLLYWEGAAEALGHDAFWDIVRRNQAARGPNAAAATAGARPINTTGGVSAWCWSSTTTRSS
jgi:hypothetical protein